MQDKKFIFAGNRFFVLEQMLERNLRIDQILAVENSYLQRVLEQKEIGFTSLKTKAQLVSILEESEYDYFVANGCPFILPISKLADGARRFVNVHPSPLPDLRGADPVPGALLHGRDSGATCHVMDDGVDTGTIIARIVIPNTKDLDCGLLYQMSFRAEAEVFALACDRQFEPSISNDSHASLIYYSWRAEDLRLDFDQSTEQILNRVRAWNTRSQGARFERAGQTYRVMDAEEVANPYLLERIDQFAENEVVFNYESALLIRHGDSFLKLKAIDGDLSLVRAGQILANDATESTD